MQNGWAVTSTSGLVLRLVNLQGTGIGALPSVPGHEPKGAFWDGYSIVPCEEAGHMRLAVVVTQLAVQPILSRMIGRTSLLGRADLAAPYAILATRPHFLVATGVRAVGERDVHLLEHILRIVHAHGRLYTCLHLNVGRGFAL